MLLLFSPVGCVLHSLSISWASHIRRTSGVRHQEWSLWGTTLLPPPTNAFCLSLFIFQLSKFLLPPHFFSSFFLSSRLPPSPSTAPQTPGHVWTCQLPFCLEECRYICWLAQWLSGQPSPANIPSMHHSQSATNELDWRNAPTPPVPSLSCLNIVRALSGVLFILVPTSAQKQTNTTKSGPILSFRLRDSEPDQEGTSSKCQETGKTLKWREHRDPVKQERQRSNEKVKRF